MFRNYGATSQVRPMAYGQLKDERLTTNIGRESIYSRVMSVICICTLGCCGIYVCYRIYQNRKQRKKDPQSLAEKGEVENPPKKTVTGPGDVFDDKSSDAEHKSTFENCGSNKNDKVCNELDDNTVSNPSCRATTYKEVVTKDVQNIGNVQSDKRHDKTESSQTATTGSTPFDSHSCTMPDRYKPTSVKPSFYDPTDTTPPNTGISHERFATAATLKSSEVGSHHHSVTRTGAAGASDPANTAIGDITRGEEASVTTSGRRSENKTTLFSIDWNIGLWMSRPVNSCKSYAISQLGANVIGFRNLGNTCFFNSVLQCVQQTLPLHNVLKEIMTGKDYIIPSTISDTLMVKVTNSSPHPLTTALQHLFHEINSYRYKESFSPYDVLTALGRENSRFSRRSQEDSHEALRCLLNAIRQDEISAIRKSIYGYYGVNENPSSHRVLDGEDKLSMKDHLSKASKGVCAIDGLIGTVLVSTTICHDCFAPLQIEELCLDLSLPMSFQSVPQNWLPVTPPSKQVSKKKRKREKKKKVVTPMAGQNKNISNITSSSKSSNTKETTTQPPKAGPGVQKVRARKMEATETYSEYDDVDISSDEDDDHLHDEDSPYNSSSSENDEENSISNATPTFLQTFTCYSDDDYLTTDSDSTSSYDDNVDSSNEDDEEFLNGYFDSTVSHLFINDDPSSAEEESDDEFVYEVDLLPLIQPTCSHKASPVATDENGNVISAVDTQDASLTGPNVDLTTSTDVTDDTSEDTEDMDSYEQPDSTVLYYKQALNEFLKRKGFTSSASIDYRSYPGTMLEQSLSDFTKLDVLDENNKFICQQCSSAKGDTVECRVSKQNLIHHLPPVLILQMKRFNIGFYNVTKDGRHVSFPLVLDMAPYCTSDCIQKMADKQKEILYGLYGLVVHHGGTLHGGHYTAYVRQRPQHGPYHTPPSVSTSRYDRETASTGKWYDISDSWVSSGCTFSDVQRCQAYLLFYELLPLL